MEHPRYTPDMDVNPSYSSLCRNKGRVSRYYITKGPMREIEVGVPAVLEQKTTICCK
jgi:hypothetical protein